ncbi:MAG: FliI/YscN family ATPase [Kofleriaceae bacterium]|nr:FliI/YscN family ATPase [Kofleriaceae bacterium]
MARARATPTAARPAADGAGDGHVTEVVGLVVRAHVPGIALGEVVRIDRRRAAPLAAEVVGFRGDDALLLPLGDLADVEPRARVVRTGAPLSILAGEGLIGRVLDGLGQPIDDAGPLDVALLEPWAVDRPAPPPLSRTRIREPLATGVRAIDGFLTLGDGQRVGLFAGSGVGKSTLLGQLARTADADVIVVCLVGERGRELAEFVDDALGAGRSRAVVVCATSDAPSLVRLRAVHVATAIAEWFRDRRGARVMLLVDSLTRVARAQREVGLSAGEPPARQGYPPSVFALLPRLVERAGRAARGSITAIYTVLVAGGDMDEPIADEVRGVVDGHIVLDRRLASRGQFPPIDLLASVSRSMPHVTSDAHRAAATAARRRLAVYEEHRDLVVLGAYKPGSDRGLDDAIAHQPALEAFLTQPPEQATPLAETVAWLARLGTR